MGLEQGLHVGHVAATRRVAVGRGRGLGEGRQEGVLGQGLVDRGIVGGGGAYIGGGRSQQRGGGGGCNTVV